MDGVLTEVIESNDDDSKEDDRLDRCEDDLGIARELDPLDHDDRD